jgi:hypothetical protein
MLVKDEAERAHYLEAFRRAGLDWESASGAAEKATLNPGERYDLNPNELSQTLSA